MNILDYDQRLVELGVELPTPPKSYFDYKPTVLTGNLLYTSGQLCFENGELQFRGKLGEDHAVGVAKQAARLCGLNILAQIRQACGGTLNRVVQCVRLTGYVNASLGCGDHAQAMDGCSNLMGQVFGENGRHTRTSVGVGSLPLDALIEIDAIFEIRRPED